MAEKKKDGEQTDVLITYRNGETDLYTDVTPEQARQLENTAFTLPGVAEVAARTGKRG